MKRRRSKKGLGEIENKTGRLDALLFGVSKILVGKAEGKLNMPGLWDGVAPLLEKQIRANVLPGSILPEEYRPLFNFIGQRIAGGG